MFLQFKHEVEHVLQEALGSYEYNSLDLVESDHADISSRVAFSLARKYRRSPKSIAEEVVKKIAIPVEDSLISEATAAGPYINFFVNDSYLHKALLRIAEVSNSPEKKRGMVIIEHTSANPDGPLHIGHLRNAIIGDGLARVLKRAGYDVETQYYVNDMGRQIAIVVWGAERIHFDVAKKPDHAVVDVYIAANRMIETTSAYQSEIAELMAKYESGDDEVVQKYESVVNMSLQGIKATMNRLNIQHDLFVFESEFVRAGAAEEVVEILQRKGSIKREGAALLLQLDSVEKELVIRRSDGTLLYTTRDLAYHRWKSSRCDRMIDVFGKDHELVSQQLTKALDLMGVRAPEFVIFAFVSLPTGSLSTRAGRYISADELMQKIEERAYAEVAKRRKDLDESSKREIARKVGIGALRYDMVKVSPEKHIVFVFEDALDIEKKGAPFIQYSYARACSIIRAADERGFLTTESNYNTALPREKEEQVLIKKLAKFEYVIETASVELKLHLVAKYARELAEVFNAFYKYCPVLSADEGLRQSRLQLVECTKTVLRDLLDALGIEAPEEM